VPPPSCPAVLRQLDSEEKIMLDGEDFYMTV
jgi:hypothetical protein